MRLRILDLDGAVPPRPPDALHDAAPVVSLRDWGPDLRIACGFRRFRRFERALAERLGGVADTRPTLTLYGSGDFHHVSLALVRRQPRPVNLLVLDKHPDWMRGVPFLHCGTWLNHASRLPRVERVFHAGGDVDFDNTFRWMAPWRLLRAGKICVLPAVRCFRAGRWKRIEHQSLRADVDAPLDAGRMGLLLRPFREDLARLPLYISIDKDVLREEDATVNWDSGRLNLAEAALILATFVEAAGGNVAGADLLGNWSEVRCRGPLGKFFHWTEHPAQVVDAAAARRRNEVADGVLIGVLAGACAAAHGGAARSSSAG
jgi:hypothetical protein